MPFLSPKYRQREIPIRAVIPNFITTMAMCAGLASLHFAMTDRPGLATDHLNLAMGAVLVSAILDVLDGRAARMLRVTSSFGAVLDSLSDFLAFGVAPVVILHRGAFVKEDFLGLAAMTVYATCAALRLARFTSAANAPKPVDSKVEKPTAFFQGMPSPAAAGVVLIPPLLDASPTVGDYVNFPAWYIVVHTFVTGLLMISTIPMFSIKKIRISPTLIAPGLVLMGLLVVGLIRDWWLTIAGLCLVYLLLIPVSVINKRRASSVDSTRPLENTVASASRPDPTP